MAKKGPVVRRGDLFISRSLISFVDALRFSNAFGPIENYTPRVTKNVLKEKDEKKSETTFAGMTLTSRRYLCDHLFYYRAEPKQFIPAFTI